MNKFVQNLIQTHSDIKRTRATRTAKLVGIEQEALLAELRRQLLEKQNTMESMTDLSPRKTTDLSVANALDSEGAARQWVRDLQRIKLEIVELEVQLDIATKTYEEWFSESSESTEATED